MSVLTQGTEIFFIDETSTPVIVKVNCATSFNPGGNPADQIDDTCLEDTSAASKSGLRRPGQASMDINADPENASHVLMHTLSESDPSPTLKWVVGWSDGTEAPTLTGSDFTLPDTRTWFAFEGYISDFPFDFTGNSVVKTSISIQRSGGSAWVKKV